MTRREVTDMSYVSGESEGVISLEGVTKSYGGFTLGPLDFALEPGYVIAVVGPNGSGKSTLFRMLMGLSGPDSGNVSLFGMRYPDDEVEIKRKVGYVPEVTMGHDDMTARDLETFVSRWYPRWGPQLYARLVERFEIPARKRFGKLSKGMKRRLSFALAVAREPDLLLLDEPTDGVDPFARSAMLEELSGYLEGGPEPGERTVLFATHVMDEVRRLADYVIFVHDGVFLGLYEKDTLQDGWRSLWVEQAPERNLPGLVEMEAGTPPRLVTDSPRKTREALEERGIGVVRSGPVDLEEILDLLKRQSTGDHEQRMEAG